MTGPNPLADRTELTPADVHRMTLPTFWWTPQGTPLLFLRQASAVALMAFAGLGVRTQLRMRDDDFRTDRRRMMVRKYLDEWWIPMTWTTHHLVEEYRKIRPATVHPKLFVTDDGALLEVDMISKPFTRADEVLGNAVPLTTMLAKFFADHVDAYEKPEVVRAFIGRRWPGESEAPSATMREMAAMLDDCDPMGRDIRSYDDAAYAAERTKALGGTPLPVCLWDLTKSRNLGRRYKGRLPDTHPIVVRLTEAAILMGRKGTPVREPLLDELMPQIDRLILSGHMAAEQAAVLVGLETKSFAWWRSWWRKGGAAARKAAYAAKPKKFQGHIRPAVSRRQEQACKALRNADWPRVAKTVASFRQDLVDRHFATIAQMITDRNLKGFDAAKMFRVKPTVISDLLADVEVGLDPVTQSTTDPEERRLARRAVERALENRDDDTTLAEIARMVRRATKIRISSEFVRAINEMSRIKARKAAAPKKKRRPRDLRRHGLTPAALRMLWLLDQKCGVSIKSLAAKRDVHASHTSVLIGQLVQAGHAILRRDPDDWRSKSVTLSAQGAAFRQTAIGERVPTRRPAPPC